MFENPPLHFILRGNSVRLGDIHVCHFVILRSWRTKGRGFMIDAINGKAYTYIVECADGSLYTGWTFDLEKRMESHNSGKGSKYTRSRLPVKLVYYEIKADKKEAMKREYAIKRLTRKDKLLLIQSMGQL